MKKNVRIRKQSSKCEFIISYEDEAILLLYFKYTFRSFNFYKLIVTINKNDPLDI